MQKIILEELRKLVKIEDIISKYVNLKHKGKYLKGLCPFHQETESSFTVTPERNQFYCFGCKEKGDIFDFLMKYHGYSFMDALQEVADFYCVEIENKHLLIRAKKQAIFDINKIFMDECIKHIEKIEKTLYFKGLNNSIISKCNIGFCENGYDIYDKLSKKFTKEQIESACLFIKYKGVIKSIFENRIIIPISDRKNILGFGGRRIDELDMKSAKYINSFNSLVFDKSKILYEVESSMFKGEHLFIVEGYFDVMLLIQIGFGNVVGLNGTSISGYQMDDIKNRLSSGERILLFDGDKSGVDSMIKLIDKFIMNDIDVKLVILPDNQDPCEFIKNNNIKDRNEFDEYIRHHKKDGLCYKIDTILNKYNLKDIIERQKALDTIEKWLSSFNKYFIYQKGIEHLINKLEMDYETFLSKFKRKNISDFSEPEEKKKTFNDEILYQLRLMKLFLDHPDELYEYLETIPIDLVFFNPILRKIFRGISEIIKVKDKGALYTFEEHLKTNLDNFNNSDLKAIKLLKSFTDGCLYDDPVAFMMDTLKLIRLSQIDKEIQKMKKSIDNITEFDKKIEALKKVDDLTDKKNHIKLDM